MKLKAKSKLNLSDDFYGLQNGIKEKIKANKQSIFSRLKTKEKSLNQKRTQCQRKYFIKTFLKPFFTSCAFRCQVKNISKTRKYLRQFLNERFIEQASGQVYIILKIL